VTRPQLVSVDTTADPPEMTLCFPGEPARWVTIAMKTRVRADGLARATAAAELSRLTARDLELLREVARPGPQPPTPAAAITHAMIRPVLQEAGLVGPVFCPRCAHHLGHADSPAIGYLKRCARCTRALRITVDQDRLIVEVDEEHD
jgi:hypothetical protein